MRNPSGGDWNDDLRVRLAGLRLSPAREAEIVEDCRSIWTIATRSFAPPDRATPTRGGSPWKN